MNTLMALRCNILLAVCRRCAQNFKKKLFLILPTILSCRRRAVIRRARNGSHHVSEATSVHHRGDDACRTGSNEDQAELGRGTDQKGLQRLLFVSVDNHGAEHPQLY